MIESLDLLQGGDSEGSLRLAIAAMEGAETDKGRDSLTRALEASVVRKRWEVPLPQASAVAVSFDGRRIAVAVNREVVPRSSFESQRIADGDRIEILEAVGGG